MTKKPLKAPAAASAVRARAPTFRRHQVERALFTYMTSDPEAAPTRDFLVRVKHLLELDRSIPGDPGFAFAAEQPTGKGDHSLFSAYDALLLYIGVQLLDAGVKRKDVVPLVRVLRTQLQRDIVPILQTRSEGYARGDALFADFDPMANDDARVFLALPRVTDFADYADPSATDRRRTRARIVVGLDNLRGELGRDTLALDHLVILEISGASYMIVSLLLKQPVQKRGRRAG